MMGDEYFRNAFRPLLPGIHHATYNSDEAINAINEHTACVIMETVQAEAGVVKPDTTWIKKIRERCTATGTLLIFDEIQAGFGRTGTLWAFEQYDVVPDILLLGKALGGGMPIGAFIADKSIMQSLTENPVLGHMSTFGGHPVSCAAGKAALEVLLENKWINEIKEKENIIQHKLQHEAIKQLHTAGLWAAVYFQDFETNKKIIHQCIAEGLITDWFLFCPVALRFAPPLSISNSELSYACDTLIKAIDKCK